MCILHKSLFAAFVATLLLSGCGMPGAPQPPSLNLADPVVDLTATRAGNQIALAWTMPKRNTDKLLLKDKIAVIVCIREHASGDCVPMGDNLSFAPDSAASATEILPEELTVGPPRPLSYFVELRNQKGRSAGLSNAAVVVAGAAPPPVSGLTAEARKQGVLLRWNAAGESSTVVRLHRKLLTPTTSKPHKTLLAPSPEPPEQTLLVDAGVSRSLDKAVHFGQSYGYSAQRVVRVPLNGKTLELTGELTAPVRVELQDIFPPEVPSALAAVATTSETAPQTAPQYAIDLSWQPVPDANLSGYIVYRCEKAGEADAPWQRISPAQPLPSPAFRDAQVQQGHTYHYAVSALAQNGHESSRSAETEETVPNP